MLPKPSQPTEAEVKLWLRKVEPLLTNALSDAIKSPCRMDSWHEAYAYMKEPLDDFWDCIRYKGHEEIPGDQLMEILHMLIMRICRTVMDRFELTEDTNGQAERN